MKSKESILPLISHFISIIIVIFLISIIAINRDNQLFGISFDERTDVNNSESITYTDEYIIVNSTNIVHGIKGYAGATPLEIYIDNDGCIDEVKPLKNSESPRFFKSLEKKGLYSQWVGLTPQEAIEKKVDAISGATLSSKAVIKTFNSAMQYVIENDVVTNVDIKEYFSLKNIIAILVILIAAIVPIYLKNRVYRYIQLVTNIIVLGVWCSMFLSLSMIVNFVSNGFDNIEILIPLLLITIAFIYPLFGKKQHYCTWVCPFGASQEVIYSISPFKINISQKANEILKTLQKVLWTIIMVILCMGIYFEIMDYEALSIFLFNQADVPVLIIGFAFLFTSLFVKRPYCKYVCPTGYLVKVSERDNYKQKI
ncbi:MAG: 4Fe-4S binding protein [Muribaculaceae bacterium]|nr:4Fe-4S binding protein [Muribaculaceae bacterium]